MNYCCEDMKAMLEHDCDQHDQYRCPNTILNQNKDGSIGVLIKDGGTSMILLKYCPWCGKKIRRQEPKYKGELSDNLALFEILDSNASPMNVGDIGEFDDYDSTGALVIRQLDDIVSDGEVWWPKGTYRFFDKHKLRPLTKLAQQIWDSLDEVEELP